MKIKNSNQKIQESMNKRMAIVQIFILFLFIILVGNLFILQIFDLNGYKKEGIGIRNMHNPAYRGDILDRNGIKLATDEFIYEVYAHPQEYSQKLPPEELAKKLAPYLNISESILIQKLYSKKYNIINLKTDIGRENAEKIKKMHLKGISVGTLNRRFYPQGSVASHIIGYYSHASQQSIGIENSANEILSDTANSTSYQTTASGQIIFELGTDVASLSTIQKGKDVTLTIDASLQYICDRELAKTIKEKNAERGSIIVMDVTNGEILAYSSYPTFDPNHYYKYSQENMNNWSLTGIYPPGSTFKIITVATGLELGIINENSKILDTGKMILDGYPITNHDYREKSYPGEISLEYLFKHSSNVASAKLALKINPKDYYAKLKDFGFGQKTGIDLTPESIGILAKPVFWYTSKHASMGYGYGASVTAIQMISAIGAIANNGVWHTPHVIKYSNKELPLYVTSRQVVSEQTAKTVTSLLARSISSDKNTLNLDKYTVAAKTGTSRKPNKNGIGYSKYVYTSAVGYFPATNPKIIVYVVIDSPKTGADWGGTIASPVLKEIILSAGKILNIPSDK